jgi:RNA polymerase sigma-70 factor (ECF subfamily)
MHSKGDTLKREVSASRSSETRARPLPVSLRASDVCGHPVSHDRQVAGSAPAVSSLDFDQIYDTHFDFVWRSLRLLGIRDELVEDALQDTFSVVSRQLADFEGRSQLRTWLFAILHRVASNYRRTRRRKQSPLVPFEEMASHEAGPDAHVEAQDVARVVERYCEGLEPERRALFVLAVLEELPAAEVAESLSLPVHIVYSRVFTLRKGLEKALRAREVESG